MRPYEVVKEEIHKIGRFQVHMDTLAIDGAQYPYSYIDVRPSVCVLPIVSKKVLAMLVEHNKEPFLELPIQKMDQNEYCIGLIYQYRHALDRYVYEVVAGAVDEDETPAQAAIRELKEEMGLLVKPEQLIDLGWCNPVGGTSSECMYMFAAPCSGYEVPKREATEYIENRYVAVCDFETMIRENIFQNMYGIATWYKFLDHMTSINE